MRDNWTYEVTDFNLVPREYMVIDTVMLNAIAKKQHDSKPVSGIRFYNNPTMVVRPK